MKVRKWAHYIKHDVVMYIYYMIKNALIRKNSPVIKIESIEKTIDYIIENKCSVSRFGDGEFSWMMGIKQDTFQVYTTQLNQRLREVIVSNSPNHIICLSDTFGSLSQYNHFAKRFWMEFMCNHRHEWIELLDKNKVYYNTNVTRLYFDYNDKKLAKERFELIKKVWEDRDLLIVEGEKTRLGVGNDLFKKAKKIKRILAPATNAFSSYNDIYNAIIKNAKKDDLILIALGPTATILAYDLSKVNLQAIDVGHVDIEYEWMKMKAKKKCPVDNKYVNEASQFGGASIGEIEDMDYKKQILEQIC